MSNTFLNSMSSENKLFCICETSTSLSKHLFLYILTVLIEFLPGSKEKDETYLVFF